MNKKVQKSGDDSVNIQAESLTYNAGISYTDAKEIALDVFRSNFVQLSSIAAKTAEERAQDITDKFLDKLSKENPTGINCANDPDFQYSLFTMQKEYARNGDSDLGNLLVDLIVDRTKEENRSILQIVLNESLNIAPKLTKNHISMLSAVFLNVYTINNNLGNKELLGQFFDNNLKFLISDISENAASYQHIEFTGCGSISMGSKSLESLYKRKYKGIFSKGFTKEHIDSLSIQSIDCNTLLIPCLNDTSILQFNALNEENFKNDLESKSVDEPEKKKLVNLFSQSTLSDNEVKDFLIELRPYMKELFDVWEKSQISNLQLSSVGIAIGHANIKKEVGGFTDLSIWIN